MALALGMTVQELLERVSSRELTEWMAFYQLEPWGTEIWDFRAGLIAAAVANAHRGRKTRPFRPTDFMPHWDEPVQEEQSWEEQERIMAMWGRVWDERFDGGGS